MIDRRKLGHLSVGVNTFREEKSMRESKTTESKAFQRAYLIGTVIIWVGIWVASAVILEGTPYFIQILPILFGGMFWFVLVIPGAFFWTHPKPKHPLLKEGTHTNTDELRERV
jgi:hypothetical protein